MRLLLDESVPNPLRRSLSEHSVRTVVEAGWSGVKNGKLPALLPLVPSLLRELSSLKPKSYTLVTLV
jgi:hypothetical protein